MVRLFPFLRVIIFSILLLSSSSIAQSENLKVHFIDVGYGDAIFVEFPDTSNMLIDAGEQEFSSKLIDYLHSINVEKIHTSIITHPHTNHFQGFGPLLKEWPINRVFINGDENAEEGYIELLNKFEKGQIPVKTLKQGESLDSLPAEVQVKILHPATLEFNANGNSLVSWLQYKQISILLLADIEPEQQDDLIRQFEYIQTADCIKIPHHGGPLSDKFAATLVDKIFVISTGQNQWGIPNEADLQKLNGKIYRTDQLGTIIVETDGQTITVKP